MSIETDQAREVMLLTELDRCKAQLVAVQAELNELLIAKSVDAVAARDAAKRMAAAVIRFEAVTRALLSGQRTTLQ
ncbi:hypothetical protein [Bradyrhizobium sp. Gha]|uniref:hypothetical protein n=1 Tax=Bradyrhizobium sp. Gha TaxID=1855318 RepID=UPI000B85DE5F|nr:hypothetical protein [Bradyrhizobium sp. Gha]